jgi:hypothetical protein
MNAFHVPIVGIIANLEEAQPTPPKNVKSKVRY